MTQLVDRQGNVLGRFNLVDVAAVVLVVVLVPMAYIAWRVFRAPAPVIQSVTPSTLSVDSPMRIRLHGEHFRPYLNAVLARTDQPFSVPDRVAENVQATFLIETPTDVEIQLPDLDAGRYDIYLYDEGREVAHQRAAVTLTPGNRRPHVRLGDPIPDAARIDFEVRFDVDADIAPLVTAGAADLNRPEHGSPEATPATLVSVRKASAPHVDGATGARLVSIDAVVRAGVTRDHGIWVYPEQRIRAGETFWFSTADYIIDGLITRIVATQPVQP